MKLNSLVKWALLMQWLLILTEPLPNDLKWDGIDSWYLKNGMPAEDDGPTPAPDPEFEELHPLIFERRQRPDSCDYGCWELEDDPDELDW